MHFRTSHAALLLLLSVPLFAGCDGRVAEAKAAPRVETVHVAAAPPAVRSIAKSIRVTGTLEANRDSDVAADAAGRVAATFVERGAHVKKGQLLAKLDARSSAIAAAQARADAASARADAELRTTERARTDKLVSERALATAELDRAKSAEDAAKGRVAAAEARAALQEKSVGDAFIRAPFDGIIAERWVDEGEYVRPDSRIVTLVDVAQLRLKLTIPESVAASISAGQHVAFEAGGRQASALVRFVGPALRQSSRDLVIEAIVENASQELKPGMFATARIESGEETAQLVPATAVKQQAGTNRLFVVRDGALEERIVQVGTRVGDEVVIADGIKKDEKVVAVNAAGLRDGLKAE